MEIDTNEYFVDFLVTYLEEPLKSAQTLWVLRDIVAINLLESIGLCLRHINGLNGWCGKASTSFK